jgi:2-keto-4-pentenoate hydratase/2-oxohepta-3-ene-1,7-dioic acid hydratase in catechol pathway
MHLGVIGTRDGRQLVELAAVIGHRMRNVSETEVLDLQAVQLRTRVSGETMQDSSTAEMIFGVAELLAFYSRAFTLEPGDVLLTGTPWGCGEFMTPRRSLAAGDVVEVEAEGIGVLRNSVVYVSAA